MSIKYKFDILKALKEKGYNTNKIRKEKLFGEATLTKYRKNEVVLSKDNLELLCKILECQIGDLIEYIPEN